MKRISHWMGLPLCLLTLLALMITASAAEPEEGNYMGEVAFFQYEAVCIGEESGGEALLLAAEDLVGAENALRRGILEMEASVDLSQYAVSVDHGQALLDQLKRNYPELFTLDSYGYSYDPRTNTIATVFPEYNMTAEEYERAKAFYDSELARIAGLVNTDWSDLEKVLFVHDYLAANYEYDTSCSRYDAYHFFHDKTGVCQAYTMAFMAVMQKLGIEVSYVQSSNLKHIWNIVKLDGSWYHVDVTHDDPLTDRLGCAQHTYFLCSDSGLTNHDVDGKERDWVYGVETAVNSTIYDGYFWKNVLSPFTRVGESWYFIESDFIGTNTVTASRLMCWDGENGAGNKTVLSGILSVGSGLGYFAGKLYFNTVSGLYSYDLYTGETAALLTSSSINGCRVEDGAEGKVLKYQNGTAIEVYQIDPYTNVSDIYGYYRDVDGLFIRLQNSGGVIVAGFDQNGRMEQVEIFTAAGEYTVSRDAETAELRVIAVSNAEAWLPLCEMHSFAL